ncbi:hypothetical protein FHL15_009948 [Xylaria flabelliformis]|uniref:Uncharacterized protein n=1 Tax=Xylaria flabelliformis TaxID=2512241 RepID=A0A553HME7_9PEZI|nr:hypothetical protein FHL15_009948 [Xylaria flabelliformis]
MSSENDTTPSDVESKPAQQPTRKEDSTTKKPRKNDSRGPVDDSHCIQHRDQEWNIDKTSWKSWCHIHRDSLSLQAVAHYSSKIATMKTTQGIRKYKDLLPQNTRTLSETTSIETEPSLTLNGDTGGQIAKATNVERQRVRINRGKKRAIAM